ILAIYQLTNIEWKLRFYIRPRWQRLLPTIFCAVGLISLAWASLLSEIPPPIKAPFGNTLLFELIAFVAFISSPITFFRLVNRNRIIFNVESASRFYQILLREVARPTGDNLPACINIIHRNIGEIAGLAAEQKFPHGTVPMSKRDI